MPRRHVYVVDYGYRRVMRWENGRKKGTMIVGGNAESSGATQSNANCLKTHERARRVRTDMCWFFRHSPRVNQRPAGQRFFCPVPSRKKNSIPSRPVPHVPLSKKNRLILSNTLILNKITKLFLSTVTNSKCLMHRRPKNFTGNSTKN